VLIHQAVMPEALNAEEGFQNNDENEADQPPLTIDELKLFALRPTPLGRRVLCRIIRSREGIDKFYPKYELFLERPGDENTEFLLSARKTQSNGGSTYIISTNRSGVADASGIIGYVRSNFVGTAFAIYDNGINPFSQSLNAVSNMDSNQIRQELGAVVYEPNILGFKGPRKMTIVLHRMDKDGDRPEFRPNDKASTLLGKLKIKDQTDLLTLHNKSPQWNEETQSYVLNFGGRVTLASVKNFQIIHDHDLDYIIMQFGRVSDTTFTMDFQYPMCPLLAFGIALTSFDAKLACE